MTLSEYLTTFKISAEDFALRLSDASESGVRKWATGERIPRVDQMREIYRITEGAVAPNDFYGLGFRLMEQTQS